MNEVAINGILQKFKVWPEREGKQLMIAFSLAHRYFSQQSEKTRTHWFNVVAFGQAAQDIIDMELEDGSKVVVGGSLSEQRKTSPKCQRKHSFVNIVAQRVQRMVTPEPGDKENVPEI